jgi:hypothetical protein
MPEGHGRHGRHGRAGTSKRWLWTGVVIVCVGLLAAAIHFAFGAWAWSAAAFFSVATSMGLYYGVSACGAWTETPLLEMARARNRPYFGGSGAIARHIAYLTLWSFAIGVYSLVLVYAIRVGMVQVEGLWAEHFGGEMPNVYQPNGRLGLTLIIAFSLCRATARIERVAAAQRGEELSIDDGSFVDDANELKHTGLLKLAIVRLMIVFLVPIYKELRRKTGLMESAAHALLMREFGYTTLTRAGYVLIERYDHRAIRELRDHLAATQCPGEPDKETELKAGLVASALYQLDGYYAARERIRAYTADLKARSNEPAETGVRVATRHTLSSVRVPLQITCEKHGDRRARLLDYRADARGLGLLLEHCSCFEQLERAQALQFELNSKIFVGEVRHRSYRSGSNRELHVGLQLQDAVARDALAELQRYVHFEH